MHMIHTNQLVSDMKDTYSDCLRGVEGEGTNKGISVYLNDNAPVEAILYEKKNRYFSFLLFSLLV